MATKKSKGRSAKPLALQDGKGRSTTKYLKDQVVFYQGDAANAVFHIQKRKLGPTAFPHGYFLTDDIAESVNRAAEGMIRIHRARALEQALAVARMVTLKDRQGERMWQDIASAIQKKQGPLGPRLSDPASPGRYRGPG